MSCYVIVVSTWTKIGSIQWGTGQFGSSCKLLPLRVTIILLRCSKELNDKIESRYLLSSPLTTTILTAARKGSGSRIFSKPVFKLRTTRPPFSRDCFFVMLFHWLGILHFCEENVDYNYTMYKVISTESTICNGCSARRLWSFFDLNLGKSWHVIHSVLCFLHTWQCWAFSAVQMQNASTCHLQMRIKGTSFLGACLSAVRDPVQVGEGKCMKIKTESWLKPCLQSSSDKWNT